MKKKKLMKKRKKKKMKKYEKKTKLMKKIPFGLLKNKWEKSIIIVPSRASGTININSILELL